MKNAWKQWDFSGSGLQTLNLALIPKLRLRPIAYSLWALFPLGLHAFYLQEPRRGLAYIAATTVCILLLILTPWPFGAAFCAVVAGFALFDVATLERRLNRYNKALRMATFLHPERTPPPGYRGRYTDQDIDISDYLALKNQEQAGHSQKAVTAAQTRKEKSFQEQEAAIRELAERQKTPKNRRS